VRWIFVAFVVGGCIKSPQLILVDRKTALEEQAAGSFRGLEDDLEQAGISPRPTPLTGSQAGTRVATAAPDDEAVSDEERLDGLLVRSCVGEAADGTLAVTTARCTGTVDVARVTAMVERANRNRWQVWRYLQEKRPRASLDEVRRAWQKVHADGVVCGGQVQRADGGWEAKKC
jgi:hypothetical protein